MAYLGYYTFSNPNKEAWYGIVNKKENLWPSEEDALEVGANRLSNVHGNFVRWFFWGFIQHILPCAGGLFIFVGGLIHP